MTQLPAEYRIGIPALTGIFRHATNSYKFLLFQALLQLIKKGLFKKIIFSFKELEEEMLEIADYPINVFKLNFGSQDQMAEKLDGQKTDLVKCVPYRLLSPFFEKELKGMADAKKNNKIEQLSKIDREYNSIYKINYKRIEVYPEWIEYFMTHFVIIEGWVFWHWVSYLQNKNPNAIALVNKLQKPSVRATLNRQREYWEKVLKEKELECIFSQKIITREDLSLDHFLPWSFIGHDQLWNLIPVSGSVNSSKSSNIPSMNKYLKSFIELQNLGLNVSHKVMTPRKWEKEVDDFVMGLNISFSDLKK